jgi:pimeloyl-ACP methyl ester carboxylesterase
VPHADQLVWVHAGGAVPSAAHALLRERYALRLVEAHTLGEVLSQLTPTSGGLNVWATGQACAEAVAFLAANTERVSTLILEAPTRAADPTPLSRVNVPTLVLYGTDDANSRHGHGYRAALPTSHLVFVYAAATQPAVDRPTAFVSLVTDFLSRHERFLVTNTSGLLWP